ncbi:hypothetical protein D3C81_1858020 [compost metagenome]
MRKPSEKPLPMLSVSVSGRPVSWPKRRPTEKPMRHPFVNTVQGSKRPLVTLAGSSYFVAQSSSHNLIQPIQEKPLP